MNHKLLLVLCNIIIFSYASENRSAISCYSDDNGKVQEDRFSIASICGTKKDFFGVYDGHCDSNVAEYLKNNLAIRFAASLKTCATKKEAFELAFKQIEEHALCNMVDGSTAVAVYLENNIAHIAWVGDSRAVLANTDNKVVFATSDHNCERPDELARIYAAGGIVLREKVEKDANTIVGDWRINRLGMSRAIGDPGPKGLIRSEINSTYSPISRVLRNNTKVLWQQWPGEDLQEEIKTFPSLGQVIAEPEYAQISLTEKDRWFIIASDGLWDKVKSESAVNLVMDLARQYCSVEDIAKSLAYTAIMRGSNDNVTVMVIDLSSR